MFVRSIVDVMAFVIAPSLDGSYGSYIIPTKSEQIASQFSALFTAVPAGVFVCAFARECIS